MNCGCETDVGTREVRARQDRAFWQNLCKLWGVNFMKFLGRGAGSIDLSRSGWQWQSNAVKVPALNLARFSKPTVENQALLEVTKRRADRDYWNLLSAWLGGDEGWVNNISENEIAFFGRTNYRGNRWRFNRVFGIRRKDRRSHMFLIGKTGTGKTHLLKMLILGDLNSPHSQEAGPGFD